MSDRRKRAWDVGASAGLLLVVLVIAGVWVRQHHLDQRLAAALSDTEDVATRGTPGQISSRIRTALKAGASLQVRSPQGTTVLHAAAQAGDLELVRQALARGQSPNVQDKSGERPLTLAAIYGQYAVMRELLRRGAEVNAVDEHGMSALHIACAYDEEDEPLLLQSCKILIQAGADPSLRDAEGHTPMYYATDTSRWRIVKLLKQPMAVRK